MSAILKLLREGKREWCRLSTELSRLGGNIETIKFNHQRLTDRVYQIEDWSRKPFTAATIKTYIGVIDRYFNGRCACCSEKRILNKSGVKNQAFEVDHFKGPKWNNATEGWAICRRCHSQLTHGYLNREGWVLRAFQAFQVRVRQWLELQNDSQQLVIE